MRYSQPTLEFIMFTLIRNFVNAVVETVVTAAKNFAAYTLAEKIAVLITSYFIWKYIALCFAAVVTLTQWVIIIPITMFLAGVLIHLLAEDPKFVATVSTIIVLIAALCFYTITCTI